MNIPLLDLKAQFQPLRAEIMAAVQTVCDEQGCENVYSIVGIDEADVANGRISWVSPLARALTKLREGEVAMLRTPVGVSELEIVSVVYCEIV